MSIPEREHIDRERLARFIAGECTEEERSEVQAWIDAKPSRSKLIASLEQVWKLSEPSETWDVDRGWREFAEKRDVRIEERSSAVRPRRAGRPRNTSVAAWAARAAAAVALLAGGALVLNEIGGPERVADMHELREYVTDVGEQTDVQLSDGSVVTLAPASRLRVARFDAAVREVHLAGEAVFDVTHEAARPFLVHIPDVLTEVLGTTFVVRAYEDDESVSIALIDGAVRVRAVSDDTPARAVTLEPGQVAYLVSGSPLQIDAERDASSFLAWTEGQLVFRDTRLADVARELGRWYDVDVGLADSAIAERRLTASFGREPIDQVLDLIALSLGVRYERSGRDVVLSR